MPPTCTGTAGPMTLGAVQQPWAGGSFESTCTGFAANSLALSVVGFATATTPLSQLHPTGIPGCQLLATTDAVMLVLPSSGTAALQFPIPFDPAFVGVTMHHQFLQLETAPAVSLLGANGVTLTVGYF